MKICLFFVLTCACFGQAAWKIQTWIPSDAARLSPSETQSILTQICADHVSEMGCSVCPEGMPTGGGGWQTRAIFLGHFQSPSSEDVLVGGFGCESHAEGVGGSFLFTKRGPSWVRVRYAAGMIAWDCGKLMGSDGRDRLVCGAVDGGQGHITSSLFLLDPGVERVRGDAVKNPDTEFFAVEDTTGAMETRVERGFIERVEFAPMASGHQTRIVVFARLGRAKVPKEIVEKSASGKGGRTNIATLPCRYEFVFNGAEIRAAAKNPPVHDFTAVAPVTSYSIAK